MPRYFDTKNAGRPREASKDAKNVWKAMRHARRFTLVDLVTVTGLTKRVVAQILVPWRQANIVRDDNDGFRLARDLGPVPPYRSQKVAGLISRTDGEILPLFKLKKRKTGPMGKAKAKAKATPSAAAIARRRAANNRYARENREQINATRRARRHRQRTEQLT